MKKMSKLVVLFVAILMSFNCTNAVEPGFVSSSAQANKEYAPDVATVKFYVETYGKVLKESVDKNTTAAKASVEAVKKQLNAQNGETIKTSNYSVVPMYVYKNSKQEFDKYKITNSFEIKVKDLAKVGDIIAIGLQNGATRIDSLNFKLEASDKYCNALITEATANAKNKAKIIATASGAIITGVKQASASCSTSNYTPVYARYTNTKALSAASEDSAVEAAPIEAGVIKLYATSDLQYFVK